MYHTFSMRPSKTNQFFFTFELTFSNVFTFWLTFCPLRCLQDASEMPPRDLQELPQTSKNQFKSHHVCNACLNSIFDASFDYFLTFCNIILSLYSHQNIRPTWHRFHFTNQWISTSRTTQTHLEINNRCDIASKTASKPPRRLQDSPKTLSSAPKTPPGRLQSAVRRL